MQNVTENNLPENKELTRADYVKFLQALGFHVFPLVPNSKLPAIKDYPNRASNDDRSPWELDPSLNIGISTTRFNSKCALIVVDVDNKPGKNGNKTINDLELNQCPFPETLTQITPTGGYHFIYYIEGEAVCQRSANFLGQGVDIRSRGGYIVGAGSAIDSRAYRFKDVQIPIAKAPEWLVIRCKDGGMEKRKTPDDPRAYELIGQEEAVRRATEWLSNSAPIAISGMGGDGVTFFVACKLCRDFGVSPENALDLMADHWNNRCEPPWGIEDLKEKIKNASSYGNKSIGENAIENKFSPIISDEPIEENETILEQINKEFALVTGSGSRILWETKDSKGRDDIQHLSLHEFHLKLAPVQFISSEKWMQASRAWVKSSLRREYKGIVFEPGQSAHKDFYNLWRGFSVDPLPKNENPTADQILAFSVFKEHLTENICAGDKSLAHWFMQFFAHLCQKPMEKPTVAIVMKGSKGTGKNILISCLGSLMKSNYMLTSNRRDLLSNFNGHMQNLLMFVLDEAFWSGDHAAEGILKDLITGEHINIEHKGKEKFVVNNCMRVVIIGNEDWIVPASPDERRYAVFEVGEGKKQNTEYFTRFKELMYAKKGREYLLRILLDYDLRNFNPYEAPDTKGLTNQKIESLKPTHQWWSECLNVGKICANYPGWPEKLDQQYVYNIFLEWCADRKIRSWTPPFISFSRWLNTSCKSIAKKRERTDGELKGFYIFPSLKNARADWDKFIGADSDWGDDNE